MFESFYRKLIISGPAIISDFDRLIFIHLYRTGGKSIRAAFFRRALPSIVYNIQLRLINREWEDGNQFPGVHSSLQEIFNFLPLKKFLKYDKVSVIRDPYSRLISHYKHLFYTHISELCSGKILIKELNSPKFFVEKLYKKSKKEILPSSHHNLLALGDNGDTYLPDHIFSWKDISYLNEYLKKKYNFKEFVNTASEEIEKIYPSWRDPSSKKGIYLELDQFLNNNIEEFKDYRSFIEDIWQEEILLMNTNKISSFGEVLIDKEEIHKYLSKFSIKEFHKIAKNHRNNFYNIDLIIK